MKIRDAYHEEVKKHLEDFETAAKHDEQFAAEMALSVVIRFAKRGESRSSSTLARLEEMAEAEAAATFLDSLQWKMSEALTPTVVPFGETATHRIRSKS